MSHSGDRFQVRTEHPIALDSLDHQEPWGTRRDNFSSIEFCAYINTLLGGGRIRVLDLGCAGGKMVRDFLELGHIALGLEGSDFNLKTQRAEWPVIPENLLTCDCSRPFQVLDEAGVPARFDLVTAWDVLEHFPTDRLPQVLANIRLHLRKDGLVMATIPPENNEPVQDPYHLTMRPTAWWRNLFENNGFAVDEAGLAFLRERRPRGDVETVHAYRKLD